MYSLKPKYMGENKKKIKQYSKISKKWSGGKCIKVRENIRQPWPTACMIMSQLPSADRETPSKNTHFFL